MNLSNTTPSNILLEDELIFFFYDLVLVSKFCCLAKSCIALSLKSLMNASKSCKWPFLQGSFTNIIEKIVGILKSLYGWLDAATLNHLRNNSSNPRNWMRYPVRIYYTAQLLSYQKKKEIAIKSQNDVLIYISSLSLYYYQPLSLSKTMKNRNWHQFIINDVSNGKKVFIILERLSESLE